MSPHLTELRSAGKGASELLLSPSFLSCFLVQHRCLHGTVCPVAAAATSYCGSCDLDSSVAACTWVLSAHPVPEPPSMLHTQEPVTTRPSTLTDPSRNTYKMADTYGNAEGDEASLCSSHEELVYSGDASTHTYTGEQCHQRPHTHARPSAGSVTVRVCVRTTSV